MKLHNNIKHAEIGNIVNMKSGGFTGRNKGALTKIVGVYEYMIVDMDILKCQSCVRAINLIVSYRKCLFKNSEIHIN